MDCVQVAGHAATLFVTEEVCILACDPPAVFVATYDELLFHRSTEAGVHVGKGPTLASLDTVWRR